MKEVKLSEQGKHKGKYVALVDDKDFALVNEHRWQITIAARNLYATGNFNGRIQKMHRFILGVTDPNTQVDHKNGKGLDNRRENLRTATAIQNAHNRKCFNTSTSGVAGVTKCRGKWRARIMLDGKRLSLGVFSTLNAAKQARHIAEQKYYGEYTRK